MSMALTERQLKKIAVGYESLSCSESAGVFEEIMGGEVPPAVAVNEAIELVKKFDTDTSAKYIYGVVGGYVRSKDVG